MLSIGVRFVLCIVKPSHTTPLLLRASQQGDRSSKTIDNLTLIAWSYDFSVSAISSKYVQCNCTRIVWFRFLLYIYFNCGCRFYYSDGETETQRIECTTSLFSFDSFSRINWPRAMLMRLTIFSSSCESFSYVRFIIAFFLQPNVKNVAAELCMLIVLKRRCHFELIA